MSGGTQEPPVPDEGGRSAQSAEDRIAAALERIADALEKRK